MNDKCLNISSRKWIHVLIYIIAYCTPSHDKSMCFSSVILIITNALSINELSGVTGRVDVVHSIYI